MTLNKAVSRPGPKNYQDWVLVRFKFKLCLHSENQNKRT